MTPLGWIVLAALLVWGARHLWLARLDRRRADLAEAREAACRRYLRRTMPRDGRRFDAAERRRQEALLRLWQQLT